MSITIRFYHKGRAQVEGQRDREVDAHGWHYDAGDTVVIDGIHCYLLTSVSTVVEWDRRLPGGDPYVRATARLLA